MNYKLSNIATLSQIEKEFNLPFRFPHIYYTQPLVNGVKETVLPIITMEDQSCISHGIWGILPEDYNGKWKTYQKKDPTLEKQVIELFNEKSLFHAALKSRRCLFIVTGFFTYAITNNEMQPIYIHLPNETPFCIAGVYNKLDDGFITCSIVLSENNNNFNTIPNVNNKMPLIIPYNKRDKWLDKNMELRQIKHLVQNVEAPYFCHQALAEEYQILDYATG